MTHCPGQPWLLTSARVYLGAAWLYTHQYQQLRNHAGAWLEEARARDDRYAVAALAGVGAGSIRFALDEQPEAGLSEIEAAMAPWNSAAVTTMHVGAYMTKTSIMASSDEGRRYLDVVEREGPRLGRALMMRNVVGRYWLYSIRIQALLKAVRARSAPETPELIARARADLRQLCKLKVPNLASASDYFEAWLRMLEGDQEGALRSAKISYETLAGLGQPHQLMALYLVGALEGGASGSAKCAQARAGFEAEGWRDWRRGLSLRLPGRFDLLERERAR